MAIDRDLPAMLYSVPAIGIALEWRWQEVSRGLNGRYPGNGPLPATVEPTVHLRGPIYASWTDIVARAEEVLVEGCRMTVVVRLSNILRDGIKHHDLASAAITAVIFKNQLRFQHCRCIRVCVRDSRGMLAELQTDLTVTERKIAGWRASAQAMKPSTTRVPAPVVAFLMHMSELTRPDR